MTREIDDGLTDEERTALQDDDGSGTEDAPNDIEKGAEDDAAKETSTTEEKPAGQTEPATDEQPAAAAATEPAADEPPEAVQKSLPVLVATPPEDAQAKLTDIAGKKDALIEQFDNGDITAKEYQKGLDGLSREERQIEMQVHEFNLSQKLEQQRLQNDWVSTCNSFVEANPVYKDNPRLYRALDAEVRDLAGKADTANWSGQKFLDEAHKNIKQAFGLPDGVKTPTPAPQANKRELPPNLAKVPAADVEDTNGGRFAVLDRMANSDPIGYEETLAKMPQAERDAYLNA